MCETTQRKFRRLHAATDNRPSFEDHTAISSFRQIRSSNQAVVPCARNDDVVLLSHARLTGPQEPLWFHTLAAILRPDSAAASRDQFPFPIAPPQASPLRCPPCSRSPGTYS